MGFAELRHTEKEKYTHSHRCVPYLLSKVSQIPKGIFQPALRKKSLYLLPRLFIKGGGPQLHHNTIQEPSVPATAEDLDGRVLRLRIQNVRFRSAVVSIQDSRSHQGWSSGSM